MISILQLKKDVRVIEMFPSHIHDPQSILFVLYTGTLDFTFSFPLYTNDTTIEKNLLIKKFSYCY